jgi:hypothetical protein
MVQQHMQHQGLLKPAVANMSCEAAGLNNLPFGMKALTHNIE